MPHFLVVPVPYTAHAVPPGCRAERYLHFLTSVLAEVPEADPDDARVAVTATLPEGDENPLQGAPGPPRQAADA